MAAATLVLGVPQLITLEATVTNLREVVVPAGCRSLLIDREEPIFVEVDTGQADGGAEAAAAQQRFPAGLNSWRVPGSGQGASVLTETVSVFVRPTSASQVIRMTAQREG
jgi:hypothetical protein